MKSKTTKKSGGLLFQIKPATNIADQLKAKVISDRKINFSKVRAFSYLELDTFQGERPVNERHVQTLYNAWSGGRFMWEHVILAIAVCNGRTYRINGQHTCWMRVNIPDDHYILKGEEPQVREMTYEVSDEEQLRALYSTFDQNKARTPGHVFKALLSGTQEVSDLWPSSLNVLGAGMKVWLFEKGDRWGVSSNDMAALVTETHEKVFRTVGLFFQKYYGDAVFIRRSAILGAMFATFDKNPDKAPEFWEPIVTGLNLTNKTDPRFMLRKFIDTHKETLSVKSKVVAVSSEDTYRVAILAWNKWRRNQPVAGGLRVPEERPKAL